MEGAEQSSRYRSIQDELGGSIKVWLKSVLEESGQSGRVQDRVHRGSRRVKTVLEGPGSRILESQKLLGRSGSVRTSLGWFQDV